ncbi:MAG: FtsX-like permease family protein [Bacteroidetes bacterium]|nr:FtsX-like permease family protein [Bacteroidota bacterium]
MSTYFIIAWRNLWRNSRRTLITSASIFFGVFFAIFMSSLQQGSFENMVDNMVRFYSGYIQVQESDFNQHRSLNNSMHADDNFQHEIDNHALVTQSSQRIESFALASSDENSFPCMLFGIQPEKEEAISGVSKWLSEGNFIKPGSKDLLVGKVLAKNLKIGVNDSIVLIGQGYHGVSSAGIYRISGILDFPLPDLSKQLIYMDLQNAQEFFSMPGLITSQVVMVEKPEQVAQVIFDLAPKLGAEMKIYSWDTLQPELVSLIDGKTASGKIVKLLLFMVIGFGVWATIIMLMHERKRELGVMIAVGFQKTRIMIMIIIESAFIGLIGVLIGIGISYPIIWYLFNNPIHVTGEMAETYKSMGFEPVLKFGINPNIFLNPAFTILVIFTVLSIYEIWYVARLKTVTALKA